MSETWVFLIPLTNVTETMRLNYNGASFNLSNVRVFAQSEVSASSVVYYESNVIIR